MANRTISVLCERSLAGCRFQAASFHRKLLVQKANEDYLHVDPRQLDRVGRCKLTDMADITIEEVEVLYEDDQEHDAVRDAVLVRATVPPPREPLT